MLFIYTVLLVCHNFVNTYSEDVHNIELSKTIINQTELDDFADLALDSFDTADSSKKVGEIPDNDQKLILEGDTITKSDVNPTPNQTNLPNTTKRVRKQKRRRLHKGTRIDKKLEKSTTLKVQEIATSTTPSSPRFTTSTLPTPRTFTKRPVEYNPVFKKGIRERSPAVRIIDEKNFVYGHNGDFHYSYEGGDGTKIFSQGELKSSNKAAAGESVVGGFFYKDGEGNDYSVSYTADENGYRPVGTHLPTPPPIPPAIARALQYLATKPTPQPVTGAYYDY